MSSSTSPANVNDIPELASLARTVARSEDPIVAAALTGVSNARSEGAEPDRQARSPQSPRAPQPREPAPPRQDGLHLWNPVTRP